MAAAQRVVVAAQEAQADGFLRRRPLPGFRGRVRMRGSPFLVLVAHRHTKTKISEITISADLIGQTRADAIKPDADAPTQRSEWRRRARSRNASNEAKDRGCALESDGIFPDKR
jgi:hypothetical protein